MKNFRFILIGGIIMGVALGAAWGNKSASSIVRDFWDEIKTLEEEGKYPKALKIAKEALHETSEMGADTQNLSTKISSLEKRVLDLGFSRMLFNEKYEPRDNLLQLLRIVGMPEDTETLEKINTWAQANLLRDKERWNEQTQRFEVFKEKLMPLLKALGFIEEVSPSFQKYDAAAIHGGLFPRVRLRLYDLIEQWKKGIRFKELYFLGGERPLEPEYESETILFEDKDSLLKIRKDWKKPEKLPQTESEMMQMVWEQSEIPQDMRKEITVHFVNAPMKEDPKTHKKLRPTTDDTIQEWLKSHPVIGRYLTISNAPYIDRQDAIFRFTVLKASQGYKIDTMGSKAREGEKIAIILDEVARTIFEIYKKNQSR
jgi:hypothetical protein